MTKGRFFLFVLLLLAAYSLPHFLKHDLLLQMQEMQKEKLNSLQGVKNWFIQAPTKSSDLNANAKENNTQNQTEKLAEQKKPSIVAARKVSIEIPKKADLRFEVYQNPHGTPQSMIEFAQSLSDPMQRALAGTMKKGEFSQWVHSLQSCALDADRAGVNFAIRALCWVNLNRLGVAHEKLLGEQVAKIKTRLPARVLEISETLTN